MQNTFSLTELSDLVTYAQEIAQAIAQVEVPSNTVPGKIDFLYYRKRKEIDITKNGDTLDPIARIHIDTLSKDEVISIEMLMNQ